MAESPSAVDMLVPDFSAQITGPYPFRLSDHAGHIVVLYFYPKDNTPGCTAQSIEFRELHAQFQQLGAVIVGISRDSMRSHDAFKAKLALPFELISDPDENLCLMFNVMKQKNMYGKSVRGVERSTFVIDAAGRLVKEWRGVKLPDHAEDVLQFIKTLR